MKKYKILKWLVLGIAIFTLLSFFLPFANSAYGEVDYSIVYRYDGKTGNYCYNIDTDTLYYYNDETDKFYNVDTSIEYYIDKSTGNYCYNIHDGMRYYYDDEKDSYYYDYNGSDWYVYNDYDYYYAGYDFNRGKSYYYVCSVDESYTGDYYYRGSFTNTADYYYHCTADEDYTGGYFYTNDNNIYSGGYYYHCAVDENYVGDYYEGDSSWSMGRSYYHTKRVGITIWCFDLMFGKADRFVNEVTDFGWLSSTSVAIIWPAFVAVLAALAFAILPMVSKNEKGFNKKGKLHVSLIISLPLCVIAVFMNLMVACFALRSCNPACACVWFALVVIAVIAASVLLVMAKKKIISIDFCGYLEGPMAQGGKRSICISKGACLAWSAGNADIVLSKETVKSVEPANKTVSYVVDGKRENFDVYNVTMTDGQEGTLSLLHAHAGSVVRAMSDLVVVPESETPRGEKAKMTDEKVGNEETTVSTDDPDDEEPTSIVDDLLRPLPPDSLIGKPLDWFASEEGLEAYKIYMTPQNYILQERVLKRYKSIRTNSDYFLDMDFFERDYLPMANAGAKLPQRYFYALLKRIKAAPLKNPFVFDLILAALQLMAKPYVINDDGEPELCATVLTPEQIVSIDKNPLLYFVKNFNVFKMKDDDMGQGIDKFYAFNAVVQFIFQFVNEIEMEETKWLFDKDTYLNDFGMVRKIKGFIKKCKELTGNDKYNEFFDLVLEKLLAEMEKVNKE